MRYLLVAHGTRKPAGVTLISELAERVSTTLECTVHVAFADVLGPTPREALCTPLFQDVPTVVVPAFLACGYHVSVDLPAQVHASGHRAVTVTPALGPGPHLLRVLVERLIESGWRRDDAVLLGAAGTSDPRARRSLHHTAAGLSALTGSRVEVVFTTAGAAEITGALSRLRHAGHRRVVIASYLLADGLFQDRLLAAGADAVTAPLGRHPGVARLIVQRFRRAPLPAPV